MSDPALTRRQLLASGLAVGARLTLDPLARRPRPARLGDIERVVIMIQENRSFDHYFGRYRGVRGFGDRSARGVLGQPDGPGGTIYPFHVPALGPTDPNRSYAMTATIDPDGRAGGPLLAASPQQAPRLSWTTMPEQLEARGISWKVYSDPGSTFTDGDNTLLFFTQYRANPALQAKGVQPTFADFMANAAAGALPQVSWTLA